ncbi:MAG: hypothetical protein PHT76_04320 [Anaerostipes sp.]|nr:hypothetical protein [Anaerostipes sp.]
MNFSHNKSNRPDKIAWEEQNSSQKTRTIVNGVTSMVFLISIILQYFTKNNTFYIIGCCSISCMAVFHAFTSWKKSKITSGVMLVLAVIIVISALMELGMLKI